MARVVAVANQKGGVAKTTTVHALGDAIAERGPRVLLVDLDPQACLTYSVGLDPETLTPGVHDVLLDRAEVGTAITAVGALHLLPASMELTGGEVRLLARTGRELVLRRVLDPIGDRFDVVLVDCPPSLGILTINGLSAAGELLIPVQCETLSHRGVGQLLETVADVRAYANPDLEVLGAVATMYEARTRHGREVLDDVRARYGLDVLEPAIPRSVRVAEAPAHGLSIVGYAPRSAGAAAYRALAATLLNGATGP